MFMHQKLVFEDLVVPQWLVPEKGDDIASYCQRLAESIDPGRPCIVGGASFGGIVALEMTRHLEAIACFLIGSVRGPQQLPRRIRLLRSWAPALGLVPISMLQRSAASSVVAARKVGVQHLANVSRQFADADPRVVRWSAKQILRWDSCYDDVLVRHIHGDRDHVFPIGNVEPDEIVEGGGHVISLTHGQQVNDFLRKQISQVAC